MKCKVKVGELRDALQMAAITVDRRQGSELGYVHLGSRKGKAGNQRIILNSTDGIGRFLIRVPCEVEEAGDLVIEPIRLSSLLDRRQDDEVVVLIEISLIYINKVRGGNLGFTFSLKPTMEVF
jgi:hypothetical protein